MKPVKFRAWDKEHKKMCMVWEIKLSHNGDGNFKPYAVVITPNTNTIEVLIEDVELLQFTGLKDSAGREIYEGDIIEGSYGLSDTRSSKKGVVKYSEDNGYYYLAFKGNASYSLSEDAPTFEVELEEPLVVFSEIKLLGNIYENPELIK